MKRRGFLNPIPPSRRPRLPLPPRLGGSQGTLHASSSIDGFQVWTDDREQEEQRGQEEIVEEDIEPIITHPTILQPAATNLLGVQFGDTIRVGDEDDEKDIRTAIDMLTVGGDIIQSDENEENQQYNGVEEDVIEEEDLLVHVVDDNIVMPEGLENPFPASLMHDIEAPLSPTPEQPAEDQVSPIQPPEIQLPQTTAHISEDAEKTSVPVASAIFDGPNPKYSDECHDDFHLAMMLFAISSDLSVSQYEALTEVMTLVKDISSLRSLPKSLQTLKDRCRKSFPLMSLKGRLVDLESNSIPPKKENPRHAYFFDPSEYCKVWLSSPSIRNTIYQGLGEFVDNTSEFWHGDAWKESVRTTSGQFVRIGDSVLLPSDCVSFHDSRGKIAMGRIKCIGINRRSAASGMKNGEYCALINRLIPPNELSEVWFNAWVNGKRIGRNKNIRGQMPTGESTLPELVMMDHREIISSASIVSHIWVYFTDYLSVEELQPSLLPAPPGFCVRHIGYMAGSETTTRPVYLRHRVLAELELQTLTREYVLKELVDNTTTERRMRRVSIPYSAFLDGFGLYRNAYYSLKGMYITPAGMSAHDRTRLYNLYVLMIGPFGCNEGQMAASLEVDAIKLGRGEEMTLHTGEKVFVSAFPLLLTGDMPQQNQNSGNKTHSAEFGCRSCFVPENQRGNLVNFNIVNNGRYRAQMDFLRHEASKLKSKAKQEKALQQQGLSPGGPYFANCYTMLDPQRCTPNDPMHAELRLCKYFAETLLEGILTTDGVRVYRAAWEEVDVPYGWGQPQNPVNHKGSMVFNEHGRIAIINPFVLMQMFLNDTWSYHNGIQPETLKDFRNTYIKKTVLARFEAKRMAGELDWIAGRTAATSFPMTSIIVKTSYMLARGSTLALKETLDPSDVAYFGVTLVMCRRLLQVMFSCASSEKSFKNYSNVPNVHLALHYQADIENFGTARNSSTMMGEQKHKIFKNHATHTNSKDSDLQLMKATNTSQTIRLMLDGSFSYTAPKISKQVQEVVSKCPVLRTRFLGAGSGKSGITPEETLAVPNSTPTPLNPETNLVIDQSPFSNARAGRHIPLSKIKDADRSADMLMIKESLLKEYEIKIWSGIRMKVAYWGFFGADVKNEQRRFRIKVNQCIRVMGHGRENTGCFYLLERILTVTIGTIVRVLFVLKALQRDRSEESHFSPYNVFKLGEGIFMFGIREVNPVVHHFVKKDINSWWENPYIPSFL